MFKKYDSETLTHDLGMNYFKYGITQDQENTRRQQLFEVKREDVVEVANKYLLDKIEKGETSQVVFGQQTDALEMFVKNGWEIERFVKGLSLSQKNYSNS